MGGNALKVPTRRYEKEEYIDLLIEVRTKLTNLNIVSDVPAWYSNKETFGDLDILIKSSTVKGDIIDIIHESFKPNEIYNNNNVKSFDYKEFQVDFIMVGDDNWETSLFYFSYNDLGNFVGRISYQMGFRFGDYGLKLVYRHENGGKKFSKIMSKDPRKIYEFLGFDYDRYLKGFDELEDIFKFVVDSKYFNPRIFDYDQLNHQNKTRNKKRKNYNMLLQHIKDFTPIKTFINDVPYTTYNYYIYEDKNVYIEKAEKFFKIKLISEINNWNGIIEEQKKASRIFNGNVVMKHFKLRGKELGDTMKNFNEYLDSLNSDATLDEKKTYRSRWILDNNIQTILEVFSKVNNLN